MLSANLERSLHRALALANDRRHEFATLEHLLLSLVEDQDALSVLRACNVDVDRLRAAPKRPSTWFRPQLESKGYRPLDGHDAGWRDVGRHERPTLEEQEEKWAKR